MATAVILAGGRSRRMGRDKTRLLYRGRTLLQSAFTRFSSAFDTVLISAASQEDFPEYAGHVVADRFPGCGPMAGLHAALSETRDDGVFLVAADMPHADPRAALALMERVDGCDACALTVRGRYEPLFAWYSRSLLPRAEALLQGGQYKMALLLAQCSVRSVLPEELGELWSEELLANVNFPADYERLLLKSSGDVL